MKKTATLCTLVFCATVGWNSTPCHAQLVPVVFGVTRLLAKPKQANQTTKEPVRLTPRAAYDLEQRQRLEREEKAILAASTKPGSADTTTLRQKALNWAVNEYRQELRRLESDSTNQAFFAKRRAEELEESRYEWKIASPLQVERVDYTAFVLSFAIEINEHGQAVGITKINGSASTAQEKLAIYALREAKYAPKQPLLGQQKPGKALCTIRL